jgi:hypothetical protein
MTIVPMTVARTDDTERRLQRLERLARLLEARWTLPVVARPIGLDGLIGLIPVAGDVICAVIAAGIVIEGARLGARRRTVWRMAGNVAIDLLLGLVPVIGDYADILYRVNSRNLALLRRDLARLPATGRERPRPL